jgi:hypothetical protein
VQAFHLPVAVGSVRSTPHVFNLECGAQCIELTLEFRAVVSPYLGRVAKNLKNFLPNGISNGFAAFVFYQSQHAEFAETTNGTQNVHFTFTITQVND